MVNFLKKAVTISLLLTVFFTLVEMVTPPLIMGIKINFMLLVTTVCIFIFYMLMHGVIQGPVVSPVNKMLIVLLVLYFFMDLMGILYSEVPGYAFERYTGHVAMASLLVMLLFMIMSQREARLFFWIIACASVTLSVITLSVFFWEGNGSLMPGGRISMSEDYNEFGTQIVIGTGILLLLFMSSKMKKLISIPLSILTAVVNIAVVLLTGSRRSILLLLMMAMVVTFYFLLRLGEKKKLIPVAVGLLLFSLSAYFVVKTAVGELYKYDTQFGSGLISRYETLKAGDVFESRLERWDLAWEEFREFGPLEILFGRGTAYDNYCYSYRHNVSLGSDYPHNMFLSEMLNGGLTKMGILFLLCFCIIKQWLGIWKRNRGYAVILGTAWIVIFTNNFISGDGIFFDKPFWIFLALNMAVLEKETEWEILDVRDLRK